MEVQDPEDSWITVRMRGRGNIVKEDRSVIKHLNKYACLHAS